MVGDKTYEEKHHYGGTVEGDTIRFSLLTDSGYDSRTPEHFTAKRAVAIVSPVASSTPQPVRTLKSHNGAVISLAITSDGRRAVSASWDQTLRLLDLKLAKHCTRSTGHTDRVTAVAVTLDGRRAVSGSSDDTLRVGTWRAAKRYAYSKAIRTMSWPWRSRPTAVALSRARRTRRYGFGT
jgi:WD40 repeat protein